MGVWGTLGIRRLDLEKFSVRGNNQMRFRTKQAKQIESETRQKLGSDNYKKLRPIECLEKNSRWVRVTAQKLNSARFPSEVKIATTFDKAGISGFVQNGPLMNRWFGDFVFYEQKVVVEYDGAHHKEPDQKAKDEFKDWALALMGYQVIRWNKKTCISVAVEGLKKILAGTSSTADHYHFEIKPNLEKTRRRKKRKKQQIKANKTANSAALTDLARRRAEFEKSLKAKKKAGRRAALGFAAKRT